jgi:predicted permease
MNPPPLAEWLLLRSHPPGEREAVAGDLAEEFDALAAREGVRAARRWYRRQMFASLAPNIARRVRSSAGPLSSVVPSGGLAMRSLRHDLNFTLRLAARRPLVTLVALASLAIGISLATVVFTLLNAVTLRPLPVDKADRLALLVERRPASTNVNFSYPDFLDYREAQQAFSDLIAWSSVDATARTAEGTRPLDGELVSGTFFDVLGVRTRLGRPLSESDDAAGARPVAVVAEALWRQLGGTDAFEPRPLVLNDTAFDIVGIADPPFSGMEVGRRAMFWVPMAHQGIVEPRPGGMSLLGERRASWLFVMGRLRDDIGLAQAEADLARVEASLAGVEHHRAMRLALEPGAQGRSSLPVQTGSTLRLLLGASLLVLLIGSANVANLMLARTADRNREFAIRAALGAGRLGLARLVLIEVLLLGGAAGGLSALVAHWGAGLALPLIRFFGEPVWLDLALDARTLAFAAAAGVGAALVGALAPAIQVLRGRELGGSLADAGRAASAGPGSGRVRTTLLVAQFALSLALVTVAALFVRSVGNLLATPTGYDIDHVALLAVDPTTADAEPEAIRQYLDRAEARLAAVPGVRAVGFARVPPVGFGGSRATVRIPGYEPEPDEDMELNYNAVTEGYFAAAGITLVAGRELSAGDRGGPPFAAVVNETMALRFWGGQAVGETFLLGDQPVEVVGVAPDVKYRMVREPPRPSFYMSVRQLLPRAGVFHVRTTGDPASLLPALREALAEVDGRVPVSGVRTLRQQVHDNVNDDRVAMIVGLALGSTALLLAAAGLFASMWYAVGRRTREFGVRMALGADAAGVRRLVLRQALSVALAGVALGAALALWLGTLIESRLYEVSSLDPVSFAIAGLVLGAAALLASWAPARRAARVDPVVALRTE